MSAAPTTPSAAMNIQPSVYRNEMRRRRESTNTMLEQSRPPAAMSNACRRPTDTCETLVDPPWSERHPWALVSARSCEGKVASCQRDQQRCDADERIDIQEEATPMWFQQSSGDGERRRDEDHAISSRNANVDAELDIEQDSEERSDTEHPDKAEGREATEVGTHGRR